MFNIVLYDTRLELVLFVRKRDILQRIVLQSQGSQHRVDINKVSLAYVYKLSMNILLMAIIVV